MLDFKTLLMFCLCVCSFELFSIKDSSFDKDQQNIQTLLEKLPKRLDYAKIILLKNVPNCFEKITLLEEFESLKAKIELLKKIWPVLIWNKKIHNTVKNNVILINACNDQIASLEQLVSKLIEATEITNDQFFALNLNLQNKQKKQLQTKTPDLPANFIIDKIAAVSAEKALDAGSNVVAEKLSKWQKASPWATVREAEKKWVCVKLDNSLKKKHKLLINILTQSLSLKYELKNLCEELVILKNQIKKFQ